MERAVLAAALAKLAGLWQDAGWAWVVGGSTGLALRGAALGRPPRDLDVYADAEAIPFLHERLAAYALDGPAPSRTDRYRSVLSHYDLGAAVAELVGGFRIEARQSVYTTEVAAVLHPQGDSADVGGQTVRLAPPAHELLFNLLRERTDRALLAAELIRRQPSRHVPTLRQLLERNAISAEVAAEAWRLVQEPPVREERP